MKVLEALTHGAQRHVSVEIEPPALGQSIADVFEMLDPLVEMGISYVDITYHAEQIVDYVEHNGARIAVSQRKKPGTAGVAGAIRERYRGRGLDPVPHVICTGFTQYATEEYLVELAFLGVENVLALRGDAPRGPDGRPLPFTPAPLGHAHADGLLRQIAALKEGRYVGAQSGRPIDFCVGAACYPEGHASSPSLAEELHWMRVKVEAGAQYFVTQMFFDNAVYWRLVEGAVKAGLAAPIVPGLKPLTTARHLDILPTFFGCSLPRELVARLERYRGSREDVRKAGLQWCLEQCEALRRSGAPSLHFYAARGAPIREILKQLP